ncbi:GntR family transcriptional regulator [Propylenella binzhouense]|uniref:GntR family transcriptional regulator n=1 Tax=Propylenella binzhouense TaxID=2555902 RepID=A0A964T4L0_9HYPH|nr:GntR family transcriptional regulator [Propylenella binzhouense]MYZ48234.1 GntR family transcriptional regulator [Propylenella binzhouense]
MKDMDLRQPAHSFEMRVNRPSTLLRDEVLSKLRQAIVNGRYRPGERLLERDLCEALGVSRTSVRESLRQLEIEHLVTVEPRRGPQVAVITEEVARQIYELRIVLERKAVALFVERAPPAAFAELRDINERFRQATSAGDLETRLQLKVRFYDVLFGSAGNAVMHTFFRQLFNRIGYLRSRSLQDMRNVGQRAAELDAFLAALEARNVAAAQDAIEAHVRSLGENAIAKLRSEADEWQLRPVRL